ncbi:DUF6804 family protein [Mesorhizobium sp. AaZ16]|uniref:DUF6804 family protein n=1 Tax=Mesorhizobium sp. AaZ16 TaxID=3402289 RepID=UPI00374FD57B
MIRIVAVIAAVALAAAILPWPYEYYQLMRLVVFGAGIYCGFVVRSADEKLAYALFFAALVFNPVLPVHLSREIWMPLDLIGAGLFAFTAYRNPATPGSEHGNI